MDNFCRTDRDPAALIRAASTRTVDEAFRTGEIVRVAHGRYALKGADAARTTAHALSGVLCLKSAGLGGQVGAGAPAGGSAADPKAAPAG